MILKNFFHGGKDFEIYYDSLTECLEALPSTTNVKTVSTTNTNSPTPTTDVTITAVTTVNTTSVTANTTTTTTSIMDEPEDTKMTDKNIDETTMIILLAGLPSFVLGAFASGALIFVYLKRRLIVTKKSKSTKNRKNFICGIKRRRKEEPKETIEENHPKIEEIQEKIEEINPNPEEIQPEIKPEVDEFTITDTEQTPKRSHINRILKAWKSESPKKKSENPSEAKKKVTTTKMKHFTIFDDFKDSNDSNDSSRHSRNDFIESRKSFKLLTILC